MPEKRKYWGLLMRLYLLSGLLLTIHAFFLTGCASGKLTFPDYEIVGKPTSVEDARAAVRVSRVTEYQEIWGDRDLDDFTRAVIAYRVAQETTDPAWSNEVIDRFKDIVELDNTNAVARAYLGSSHAIAARDYPIQGLLQILPGPGFVRLYHVKKAFQHLNQAVDQEPLDPVVRLIRAATFVGLTSFGGDEPGLKDFDLLTMWIEDRQANPGYRDIIASRAFQAEFYLAYAGALERLGRNEEALPLWKHIMLTSEDTHVQELATWKQK